MTKLKPQIIPQSSKFLIIFLFFWLFCLYSSSFVLAEEEYCPYQCIDINRCSKPRPEYYCPGLKNVCCQYEGIINPLIGKGIINPVIGIFGAQPGHLTIAQLLASFLRLSLSAAGILFLFYFVWASILYLTSQGEKEKLTRAKDHITNALVGLVLIVLVLVVISLINEIFNLNILQLELPTPLKP